MSSCFLLPIVAREKNAGILCSYGVQVNFLSGVLTLPFMLNVLQFHYDVSRGAFILVHEMYFLAEDSSLIPENSLLFFEVLLVHLSLRPLYRYSYQSQMSCPARHSY